MIMQAYILQIINLDYSHAAANLAKVFFNFDLPSMLIRKRTDKFIGNLIIEILAMMCVNFCVLIS